jgi:hypothetical protein
MCEIVILAHKWDAFGFLRKKRVWHSPGRAEAEEAEGVDVSCQGVLWGESIFLLLMTP